MAQKQEEVRFKSIADDVDRGREHCGGEILLEKHLASESMPHDLFRCDVLLTSLPGESRNLTRPQEEQSSLWATQVHPQP